MSIKKPATKRRGMKAVDRQAIKLQWINFHRPAHRFKGGSQDGSGDLKSDGDGQGDMRAA
jgi:hypothetical protein